MRPGSATAPKKFSPRTPAGVSAALAAAALALMPSGQSGTLPSALAADAEFVPDVMLREFIDPGQLAAVPVGPGRVAKPVAQLLNGSEIVKSLGESGIPNVVASQTAREDWRLRARARAELRLDRGGRFRLSLAQSMLVSLSNVPVAETLAEPNTELGISAQLP